MAKMFYTLEEAAGKLGVSEQQIKDLAAAGKLQQFRDRDKLMFKREQVDGMSAAGESSAAGMSGSIIPLADTTTGGTGIDLKGDTDVTHLDDKTSLGASVDSGISVFETGEVDAADPAARTQVTGPVEDEEELALESVGSGSGLLDLTREADDTSLGAELLDEIYPGGDTATGSGSASAVGSSGVFEGELGETGTVGASGIEQLGGTIPGAAAPGPAAVVPSAALGDAAYDGAGSGMSTGLLLGATLALVIALIAAISALGGVRSGLVSLMTTSGDQPSPGMFYGVVGGLLLLAIIFGVVGMMVGKAAR